MLLYDSQRKLYCALPDNCTNVVGIDCKFSIKQQPPFTK